MGGFSQVCTQRTLPGGWLQEQGVGGRLRFGDGLQHSLGPPVVVCPNMEAATLRTG